MLELNDDFMLLLAICSSLQSRSIQLSSTLIKLFCLELKNIIKSLLYYHDSKRATDLALLSSNRFDYRIQCQR
jgi:hypothetical protein